MKFKITKKHRVYYVYQRMLFIWWECRHFYQLFNAEEYIKELTAKEKDVKIVEVKEKLTLETAVYWAVILLLCAVIFYLFNS